MFLFRLLLVIVPCRQRMSLIFIDYFLLDMPSYLVGKE